ncbi:hypothetical protein D3C80_1720810 [compost metagenome]
MLLYSRREVTHDERRAGCRRRDHEVSFNCIDRIAKASQLGGEHPFQRCHQCSSDAYRWTNHQVRTDVRRTGKLSPTEEPLTCGGDHSSLRELLNQAHVVRFSQAVVSHELADSRWSVALHARQVK